MLALRGPIAGDLSWFWGKRVLELLEAMVMMVMRFQLHWFRVQKLCGPLCRISGPAKLVPRIQLFCLVELPCAFAFLAHARAFLHPHSKRVLL